MQSVVLCATINEMLQLCDCSVLTN